MHEIFELAKASYGYLSGNVTSSAVLAFFGGGAAFTGVLAFFANFFVNKAIENKKSDLNKELERLKAELAKEAETYKLSLKKQELIFNKELDAAGEFMKLHRQIKPSYSHPDMDYDEACADLADRFEKIESDLNSFLVKQGAVITKSARNLLGECIGRVSNAKFWDYEYNNESQGRAYAIKTAGELLEELSKIEEQLIAAIRN